MLPLRTIDKIGLVIFPPIVIAVTVGMLIMGTPPTATGPVKEETALTLCLKREDAKPINPKAMQELTENAYILSRLLKHPDNDFLRNQVEYEIPGLLNTHTCYEKLEIEAIQNPNVINVEQPFYRIVYLAAAGRQEEATAIIEHQIHAYARQ
jgi:hypothetical protein